MNTFANIFSTTAVKVEAKEAKAKAKARTAEVKAAAKTTWKAFKTSGWKKAKAEVKAFMQKAKAEVKAAKKAKADRDTIKYLKLVARLVKKYFRIMIKSLRLGCSTVEEFKYALAGLLYTAAYTLKNPSERGLDIARATAELSDADLEEDDIDDEEYEEASDPNEIKDAEIISEEIYDQFGDLAAGGKGKIVKLAAAVTADDSIKPCPDPWRLPAPSIKVLSSGSYCQSMTKYQEPQTGAAARRTVDDNIVDVIANNLFMEAIINGENITYEQCYEIAQKLSKVR